VDKIEHLARTLQTMPIAYLAVFLGFGALALAGFAIHAVYSMAKERHE
jgi:hypothetical protein